MLLSPETETEGEREGYNTSQRLRSKKRERVRCVPGEEGWMVEGQWERGKRIGRRENHFKKKGYGGGKMMQDKID